MGWVVGEQKGAVHRAPLGARTGGGPPLVGDPGSGRPLTRRGSASGPWPNASHGRARCIPRTARAVDPRERSALGPTGSPSESSPLTSRAWYAKQEALETTPLGGQGRLRGSRRAERQMFRRRRPLRFRPTIRTPVPVYTSCFVKILLAGRPDAVRSRERESSGEHTRRTPPRHLPSRGMSATGRRARWAPAIAWLGGCALVGSLWLPWYSAIDDGGPYVKDAWAVFSALPILLLAVAAIGMLMGPVAVAAPHRLRLLRLPGIAFSLVMAVVCTYRLLTPHAVSAANAETGAFLATGACLVITAAWFAPAARGHGTSVPRPVDRPGGPVGTVRHSD